LRRIGIEVIPISIDWGPFLDELFIHYDFDLCYFDFYSQEADPDWSKVYSENGSFNFFGYNTSMDWNEELGTGKNEWYLQQGKLFMPPWSEERIQHYWEWEQYLMDEILPLLPTYLPISYTATWSNLEGYETSEGLKTNWGKLSWEGLHEGQENASEIAITRNFNENLNPINRFWSKNSIPFYIFDGLITYDADINFYPHLAYDWTFLNNTHLRMTLREKIKWQTDLEGLFPDEYFDADDVVFTYYVLKYLSNFKYEYTWIEEVKKVNQYTVDFYIDQDSTTPENEPYAPLFKFLVREILPEHYLNQTQLPDGTTPDITHNSWALFSSNCFGTSLFELSTLYENEANLQFFEDCWWFDPSVDKTGMDFENRFGDYSGGITKLKIRKIVDTDQIYSQFALGQLDLINIGSNLILRNKYLENANYTVYEVKPYNFALLGYNMREDRPYIGSREPAPGDPSMTIGLAIRKAISYAIDREVINQVMYGGEFIIQDHPIYQRISKWCNPNIIRYNYDLDKAREYMRIAGFGEEFVPEGLSPWEITGIVFSSVLVVGTISFISYRLYKKGKI
jgi:ABC-type transport system substrate-binding protein